MVLFGEEELRRCPVCNSNRVSWRKSFYNSASPNPGHKLDKEIVVFECRAKVLFDGPITEILKECREGGI
jgi:hypothetical protein